MQFTFEITGFRTVNAETEKEALEILKGEIDRGDIAFSEFDTNLIETTKSQQNKKG